MIKFIMCTYIYPRESRSVFWTGTVAVVAASIFCTLSRDRVREYKQPIIRQDNHLMSEIKCMMCVHRTVLHTQFEQ